MIFYTLHFKKSDILKVNNQIMILLLIMHNLSNNYNIIYTNYEVEFMKNIHFKIFKTGNIDINI